MLKLLKVALPLASVFWVVVPLSVPVPLLRLSVTGTPFDGAEIPLEDCTWTTTGLIVAFGAELAGWVVKPSWVPTGGAPLGTTSAQAVPTRYSSTKITLPAPAEVESW